MKNTKFTAKTQTSPQKIENLQSQDHKQFPENGQKLSKIQSH